MQCGGALVPGAITMADDSTFRYPINDTLDLHTFRPEEVKELVADYLAECSENGILEVRIIHGKGKGTLREIVHAALARNPLVKSFQLGGDEGGSWGATIVCLRER